MLTNDIKYGNFAWLLFLECWPYLFKWSIRGPPITTWHKPKYLPRADAILIRNTNCSACFQVWKILGIYECTDFHIRVFYCILLHALIFTYCFAFYECKHYPVYFNKNMLIVHWSCMVIYWFHNLVLDKIIFRKILSNYEFSNLNLIENALH